MLRYTLKRVLQAIPLLFVITVLCFAMMQLAPYDPIDRVSTPDMDPATIAALKVRYGLDQPAPVQYMKWLQGLLHGDLGFSIITHQDVSVNLAARLPNTLLLALPSYGLAIVIAVVLGLIAGSRQGGWADKLIDGFASIGMAVPTFWLAMMLVYFFGYKMGWFPILGMHTLGSEETVADTLHHMVLPVTVLTLANLPSTIRYVRSSTITQFAEDYVTVQQAFGASRGEILVKHVFKNVLLPVITIMGMSLPSLVTGAFITESIFAWPGMGTYFLTAIQAFDYPVVMTVMLLSSVMVIVGNLLADICYGLVDPRIRAER